MPLRAAAPCRAPNVKVSLVTLGCDKNTVDSERYLAQLVAHGAVPTDDPSEAEVVIVNTCGFIDAAKKESIDALVEAGKLKSEGACQAVVAVGCMVQRHKSELVEALPEVDLFLGASEADRLVGRGGGRGVGGRRRPGQGARERHRAGERGRVRRYVAVTVHAPRPG